MLLLDHTCLLIFDLFSKGLRLLIYSLSNLQENVNETSFLGGFLAKFIEKDHPTCLFYPT